MVIVTAIRNPLDPFGSQITCQMVAGLPLECYIDAMLPAIPQQYELAVSIDGRPVDRASCPMILDQMSLGLVVVPQGGGGGNSGGKLIARIVGLIVIAVASYGVGAAVGASAWAAETAASVGMGVTAAGIGTAVGMSVAIAGSMVMNAILPVSTALAQNNQQSSATYGWNVTGNAVIEGQALPILYGTMRVVPPRLSIYTSMAGQAETLGLLFAVAGHAVDSITDIEINDTGDLATNYPDVITQVQLGANNNVVMQGFDDTQTIIANDVGLPGNKLTTSWRTITTQGNAITAMNFGFVFYGGLYGTSEDNQGMYQTGCSIKLEVSPHGANTWTRLQTMYPVDTVSPDPAWSGGYWWLNQGGDRTSFYVWVEIEAGSTNPNDHVDNDPYTPPDDLWVTTWIHNPEDPRPILQWRWLTEHTKVVRSYSYHPWVGWSENNTNPLRYILSTYSLTPGPYDFRYALYDNEQASDPPRTTKDVYLEYYAEIIEDDFTYPNVSLLALRSVATGKLANEIPRISCLATRSTVYVFDPDADDWAEKAATNPAWASYDALVGARNVVDINATGYDAADPTTWTFVMMTVGSVPHTRIIYADFEDWADFCDLVAPTGYPDKKAYTCNLYIDTTVNLRKALDMIGLCGRGLAVQQGASWTCVVEKPEVTPVQRFIFNMANIERDSFTEQWLPMDERANCIEMTYYPEDNNYRPKSFEIRQVGFDESEEEVKKTSLDYKGCTNRDMALAFGKYLLNCNRYLTLTAAFTAFIDAIACFPGQIIELQHDVPQFGYGGRQLAGCTTTVLLLDTPVEIVAPDKTYHLVMYHQEDDLREEIEILPIVFPEGSVWRGTWDSGGTYAVNDAAYFTGPALYKIKTAEPNTWVQCASSGITTIAIADSALTRAPSVDCKFSFGEVENPGETNENWKICKLVRVLRITRSSEGRRKLTCIEFVNEVFQDGATIHATNPSDLPRKMLPPAPLSVGLELFWKLDHGKKEWTPFVRATFNPDPAVDYTNIAIPISKIRVYAHAETGDTHTAPKTTGTYEAIFDLSAGVYEYPAAALNGRTLYMAASLINMQGMEGNRCADASLFVNTAFTPAPSTSNLSIDSYDYTNNGPSGYTVYFSWVPYGWALSGGKYAPILTWNNGANYYVFDRYLIAYGFVDATGNIPALDQMQSYRTSDIGNIFDASGVMITDADDLDAICRGAASGYLSASYGEKWLAIAVAPLIKNGSVGGIDITLADYGLDWEWVQVTCPGGTGNTVEDVQIQNAELVLTMQPGAVVLNEMNWDYTLQSPNIDGFAIIYRAQPYWWAWALQSTILSTETNFTNIVDALNLASNDGIKAANDFVGRYGEWYAGGISCFYFMISNATHYEIMKVNTQTLDVTRGVEGTTAHTFTAGAEFSYSPCEQIDTLWLLNDTTQRSYTFNPPLAVNYALHCTITAYKTISHSPGYKRCHFAHWTTVRNR